jgi:hypothetical protein
MAWQCIGSSISQDFKTPVLEGYTVTYTAHEYSFETTSQITMTVTFYDSTSAAISSETVIMHNYMYWGTFTGSFLAPPNSETASIMFQAGEDWACLDSVVLTVDNEAKYGKCEISFFEESNLHTLNNGSIIMSRGTTEVQYYTSDGTITVPSVWLFSGECVLFASSDTYATRAYILDAPDNLSVYLQPEDNCVLIRYNIIDYSNMFIYTDTRLVVSQVAGGNVVVVSDSYFDASGYNDVYLTTDTLYMLELRSGDYTRSMGNMIPVQSQSTTLVVGQIELIPESTVYSGFEYGFNKTNTSVIFTWEAQEDTLTDEISYTIYNSTDSIVYALSSSILTGTATYAYADSKEQYKIVLTVPTVDGTLHRTEYVCGDNGIIDLQVSEHWYNIISLFILILIGLLFGARSASAGALITSLSAVGLYALGVFKVSSLIIALALVLGLMAVMRGRE